MYNTLGSLIKYVAGDAVDSGRNFNGAPGSQDSDAIEIVGPSAVEVVQPSTATIYSENIDPPQPEVQVSSPNSATISTPTILSITQEISYPSSKADVPTVSITIEIDDVLGADGYDVIFDEVAS